MLLFLLPVGGGAWGVREHFLRKDVAQMQTEHEVYKKMYFRLFSKAANVHDALMLFQRELQVMIQEQEEAMRETEEMFMDHGEKDSG